ncbi:hypothetical protein [Ekhidna sp.]
MIRLIILGSLLCAMGFNSIAHNAKIATYTLRDTGNGWFIEMNFAQVAIDAQMLKLFDEETLSEMSKDQFKSAFLKYLRENFSLRVDGKKMQLLSGGILIGSHQTDVKYILPEIPLQPKDISIYISTFEDIYNQTNLFRIYRGGDHFTKFFLSADNDFTAHMEFKSDGNIYSVAKTPVNTIAIVAGIVIFVIIILLVTILVMKRLKNTQLSEA